MPIIGSAHINIRALDKNFRRDIENAVKKIRDVSVGVTVDAARICGTCLLQKRY